MNVRLIKESDKAAINRWLKTEQQMPALSFGVPGVAFAGLRKIEGGYYLFDSMVTNALCSSATRNSALQSIYSAMFSFTADAKGVIGFTVDAGAQSRAKAAGFRQLPHTVLVYTRE